MSPVRTRSVPATASAGRSSSPSGLHTDSDLAAESASSIASPPFPVASHSSLIRSLCDPGREARHFQDAQVISQRCPLGIMARWQTR